MPQSSEPTKAIRVLHIGNIANNAYLNAKILNERGFECVVAAPDYTHIMGCPEWEDADFHATPDDHDSPDWSKIDLQGFERPDWFVAEPLLQSLSILHGDEPDSKEAKRARHIETVRSLLRRTRDHIPTETGRDLLRRVRDRILRLRWLVNRLLDKLARFRSLNRIRNRLSGLRLNRTPISSADDPSVMPTVIPDGVREDDVIPWLGVVEHWRRIFERFDVVIGYGLDGLLPMLTGKSPYFAFEHGTIRAFPFEDTPRGRLCAATYRHADGVFVTNCDNRIAAERLGLNQYRFLPHPVNEHLPDEQGVTALRKKIREELASDFIVFHPSRQHWEPKVRSPNWEKGNDVLIRGFARAVETETDARLGLVMVRWGQKLDATDRLVAELGIEDRVKWIEPLPHLRMCEMILACDAVADQFYLGAFGSLTPKGLMLRRPVLLKLDAHLHEWAFDVMPPVVNTSTPEQVGAALQKLSTDRDHYEDVATASQDWYQKHHSNDRIARILIEEIHRCLDARPDDGSGAV